MYRQFVSDLVNHRTDWTRQRHFWAVRMRWGAAAFGISQVFLNHPPALSRLAVAIATLALMVYNAVAIVFVVRRQQPIEWLRVALVCADFAVCTTWILALSNDPGPLTCMILALAGVEAALLYGTDGIKFAVPAAAALLAIVATLQAHVFHEEIDYNDWIYAGLLITGIAGIVAAIVREMERQHDMAITLARIDPLTGIANRRAFFAALDSEVKRARRSGEALSVAIFDLDHFKEVNDTRGHSAGDAVLGELGTLLRSNILRQGVDVPGRLGGEEFGLILPGADLSGAAAAAERLRLEFRNGSEARPGTLSGGVASLSCEFATADELLQAADRALYASKNEGRDRITCAAEGQPAASPRTTPSRAMTKLAI